jgi:hypothetical protein
MMESQALNNRLTGMMESHSLRMQTDRHDGVTSLTYTDRQTDSLDGSTCLTHKTSRVKNST